MTGVINEWGSITTQLNSPRHTITSSAMIAERFVLEPAKDILNHQGSCFQWLESLSITVISSINFEISTSNTEARHLSVSRLALFPDSTRWIVRTLSPLNSANYSCDQLRCARNLLTSMFCPRQTVNASSIITSLSTTPTPRQWPDNKEISMKYRLSEIIHVVIPAKRITSILCA